MQASLNAHVHTLTVVDVLQDVWLEQADAAMLAENEEFTLMDWGNAIVRVRVALGVLADSSNAAPAAAFNLPSHKLCSLCYSFHRHGC